ncbi:MAG: response regulator transcription factor [Acutalibacteraceae bacterium]|nr:response regulator transcription factor [Acutalibacteraceae bacterium]
MKKLLLVEDEVAIREFEAINLQRAGYITIQAGSGEEALEIYDSEPNTFDIALLDISMPGMDGFTLCRELRKRSASLGIIMLTARAQEMDKINGLMIGADDYITKPFSPSELLARVDSLYRRVGMNKESVPTDVKEEIRLNNYVLNLRKRTLLKDDKNIELTHVEFQIIEYFFTNPDSALDRNDILTKVWGADYYGEEKIVDVNIRRLRMKIEDNPSKPRHLLTVWGMGYKWKTKEETED